jgi:hypothetical protein
LPRALGRIDTFGGSRIGDLTLLVMTSFVLVVLRRARDLRRNLPLLPAGLAVAAAMGSLSPYSRLDPDALPTPTLHTTSEQAPTDALALGLHRIGMGTFRPAHLRRLIAVERAVDTLLPPGEPFYDLSNHNADYVYLDRPVPAVWSGPYYLADDRAQAHAADQLRAHATKLLLLSADNITHDGGSAALRAHWLYRFVLTEYFAFTFGDLVFAVRRDLASQEPFRGALAASPLSPVAAFDAAFAQPDLKGIPLSWGAAETLAGRMAADGATLPLRAGADGIDVATGFDILRLQLACPAWQATQAWLHWTGYANGHTEPGSAMFTAQAGTLLVPVGAYPSWILADRISSVALTLEAPGCSVAAAALHRRLPPLR